MSKKNRRQTTDFYRLYRLLSRPASYYGIVGERSNGKTYSVKERIIDKLHDNGDKFVYMRRMHRHITRKKMKKVFQDINEYAYEKLNSFISYDTENDFTITDENGKKQTVGACVSIEDAIDLKGIPYNEIKTIFFDEFLDLNYMEDEIERFLNIISTIVRERNDVEIFLCGNTISKYCPYFELFGVDPRKLKQGEIAYFTHKKGVTFALEYCKSKVQELGKEKTHKYLGFDDNKTVDMILYGDWEYKETNIKNIDGIGWNSNRTLIPTYITSLGNVYEMSLTHEKDKILFVRKINTQNGFVKTNIKYNLSFDNSIVLNSKNGSVPIYTKVSKLFMGENLYNQLQIAKECLRVNRVVYDTFETGTEFLIAADKVLK